MVTAPQALPPGAPHTLTVPACALRGGGGGGLGASLALSLRVCSCVAASTEKRAGATERAAAAGCCRAVPRRALLLPSAIWHSWETRQVHR